MDQTHNIREFRRLWDKHYSWISLELNDEQIREFILGAESMTIALDRALDYQLAHGIGYVEE